MLQMSLSVCSCRDKGSSQVSRSAAKSAKGLLNGGRISRLENDISMEQKHKHRINSSVTIKWYSIINYSGFIVVCSMNINHNDSVGI
jgi:hypothetical protein